MSDEQLFAAGDLAALVNRYRPSLVMFAKGQTGNDQLAERIADDAFRSVAKNRDKFQGCYFRPWLCAIVDRLCRPHESEETKAKTASADAAFAVLDYLEATAPAEANRIFVEVCDRAESWPHPWPQGELMAIAQELLVTADLAV